MEVNTSVEDVKGQEKLSACTEQTICRNEPAVGDTNTESDDNKLNEDMGNGNLSGQKTAKKGQQGGEEGLADSEEEARKDISNDINKLINNRDEETLDHFSDDNLVIDTKDNNYQAEHESSSDLSLDSSLASSLDSSLDSDPESDSDDENTNKDGSNNNEIDDLADDEFEQTSGPIVSKNEVVDEEAPVLPPDYTVPENAPLELIGTISALVERNVIVKANVSGEFRVLNDNSVLCFEDRTVLGPLFETFGRLQSPFYRVKFNTDEDFNRLKDKIGQNVYYVVPDSKFLYTDSIKHIKGTDASNCNDEELPEEEQEFSDDERELAAKQEKKRKRKSKNTKGNSALEPSLKVSKREDPQVNIDNSKYHTYGYVSRSEKHEQVYPAQRALASNNGQLNLHFAQNAMLYQQPQVLQQNHSSNYQQPFTGNVPYSNVNGFAFGNHINQGHQGTPYVQPYNPYSPYGTPSQPQFQSPLVQSIPTHAQQVPQVINPNAHIQLQQLQQLLANQQPNKANFPKESNGSSQ